MMDGLVHGRNVLTIYSDSICVQQIIVMDVIVIQPGFSMTEVPQTIPLTSRLWIKPDLIIIRVKVLNFAPIDDIVLEFDPTEPRFRYVFEAPACHTVSLLCRRLR